MRSLAGVQARRTRSRAALDGVLLAFFLALGLLVGLAQPAGADGGAAATPDFALTANYKPPSFTGVLIRGGLPTCPDCTTSVEPRYLVPDPLGCFHDSNTISLVSLNDFAGTVTLEVLNLPAGVTSQTATSLVVPRRGAVSTPFKLQAASTAALGNATVTIQATSGAITHSMALPISVADQLPDCPPSLNIFPSSVVGGDSAQGTVSLTGPASTGTTITLASANAAVAQVPASVIIPAGSSSASFTVTTNPVTASTTVTISATGPGGSDVFPLQVTPPTPPPPADTVAVKLAQYDTAKQLLNVEATSTSASATLTVSVTASGQTIGTLTNAGGGTYKGQFPWPVDPQQITVQSSLGGSATATVVAK